MYTVFGNVQIKLEYSSGMASLWLENFVNKSVRRIKYQVCLILVELACQTGMLMLG